MLGTAPLAACQALMLHHSCSNQAAAVSLQGYDLAQPVPNQQRGLRITAAA
jgi:hypothetical protein